MREIKLRAWDVKNKVMHYGFQFMHSTKSLVKAVGGVQQQIPLLMFKSIERKYDPFDDPLPRDQFKICQSTGLRDRFETEIYEGDTIQSSDHNPDTFTVEFIEGGFCATYPGNYILIDINHFFSSKGCCIEVTGNIFENT